MILEASEVAYPSNESIDPSTENPIDRVSALLTEGCFREAESVLRERLTSSPGNAAIHRLFADLYLRIGNRRAAEAHLLLAADRFTRNQVEAKARSVVEMAERVLPGSADLRFARHRVNRTSQATGRHESIVSHVERMTHDDPSEHRVTGAVVHRHWLELSCSELMEIPDDRTVARLLSAMTVHDRIERSVIFRKGQQRSRIVLLVEGKLEMVDRDHFGREYIVDRFVPVSVVGKHAFFDSLAWSAELRTAGAMTTTFELNPRDFEEACTRSGEPESLRAVVKAMSQAG